MLSGGLTVVSSSAADLVFWRCARRHTLDEALIAPAPAPSRRMLPSYTCEETFVGENCVAICTPGYTTAQQGPLTNASSHRFYTTSRRCLWPNSLSLALTFYLRSHFTTTPKMSDVQRGTFAVKVRDALWGRLAYKPRGLTTPQSACLAASSHLRNCLTSDWWLRLPIPWLHGHGHPLL